MGDIERKPVSKGWWQGIASWFSFVYNRRIDTRFPVIPPVRFVTIFFLGAIACLALVIAADSSYLKLVQQRATEDQRVFEFLTDIGKADWILIASGIVILVFTVFTAERYSGPLVRVWHRLQLTFYFVFTTVAFSGLLTNLFKFLFGRLRPGRVEGSAPWISEPLTADYNFASFPSGHSTTAGSLAMALALLFPRFRYPFLALGVFVALTRNFVGAHFPSDVCAGFLFGAVFTWLYARSFARKRLLFRFETDGSLGLRGEGRGHMHLWPHLFSSGSKK